MDNFPRDHEVFREYRIGLLDVLRSMLDTDQCFWVVEWRGPSYRFFPHRMPKAVDDMIWPYKLVPHTDPFLAATPDMSTGIHGDVVNGTILVFGKLLPAIQSLGLSLLTRCLASGEAS